MKDQILVCEPMKGRHFSLTAIVKGIREDRQKEQILIADHDGDTKLTVSIHKSFGMLHFEAPEIDYASGLVVDDGVEHHFAFVSDGRDLLLYPDGV